jgi:hypothetical protein
MKTKYGPYFEKDQSFVIYGITTLNKIAPIAERLIPKNIY